MIVFGSKFDANYAKYAYLSHFYANALAIFLDKDVPFSQIPKDHFQALRNLESFQT